MAEWSQRIAPHRAELEGRAVCVDCGRPIGDDGRFHSDGLGEPLPYCRLCAEDAFPVR